MTHSHAGDHGRLRGAAGAHATRGASVRQGDLDVQAALRCDSAGIAVRRGARPAEARGGRLDGGCGGGCGRGRPPRECPAQ